MDISSGHPLLACQAVDLPEAMVVISCQQGRQKRTPAAWHKKKKKKEKRNVQATSLSYFKYPGGLDLPHFHAHGGADEREGERGTE